VPSHTPKERKKKKVKKKTKKVKKKAKKKFRRLQRKAKLARKNDLSLEEYRRSRASRDPLDESRLNLDRFNTGEPEFGYL